MKFITLILCLVVILTGCGKDMESPSQANIESGVMNFGFYTQNSLGQTVPIGRDNADDPDDSEIICRSYALFNNGTWHNIEALDSVIIIIGQGIDLAINEADSTAQFIWPLGIRLYEIGDTAVAITWLNELASDSSGNIYMFRIGINEQGNYAVIPIRGGTPNFFLRFWHGDYDTTDLFRSSVINGQNKISQKFIPVYVAEGGVKFFVSTKETEEEYQIDTLSFVRAYILQDENYIPIQEVIELTHVAIPPGGDSASVTPVGFIDDEGNINPSPPGSLAIRLRIGL